MKLVLIGLDFKDEIFGITLEDGRIPSLSTLSDAESKQFHIPDIEPAIWFKTLVLSEVIVNCNTRQIVYTSNPDNNNDYYDQLQASVMSTLDSIAEEEQAEDNVGGKYDKLLRKNKNKMAYMKRMSETMFLHANGAGQNADLDELFYATNEVIYTYQAENISKMEYYQEMFRLLHCYILPSVTFGREDIPQLKAALEFQGALITRQDEKISNKFAENEQVNQSLGRQREQFGKAIESVKNGSKLDYPHPLAITLLNDFQDDLQRLSTKLTEAQTDVNLVKTQISLANKELGKSVSVFLESEFPEHNVNKSKETIPKDGDVDDSSTGVEVGEDCDNNRSGVKSVSKLTQLENELQSTRDNRDKIFEEYKRVLHIREILSEYVSDRVLLKSDSKTKITKRHIIRSKLKLKGKHKVESPLHKIYISLIEHRNGKLKEIERLITEKVQIVSVKEGIKCALDELQTENTSYGVDFDNFGSLRSTDVMSRPGLPSNWQTLEELVKQTVDDKQHPIAQMHANGCERLLTECRLLKKFHTRYLESESDSMTHKGSPDTASLTEGVHGCSPLSFTSNLDSFHGINTHTGNMTTSSSPGGTKLEESCESTDGSTVLLRVPFGGMCIPLQNVASVHGVNAGLYPRSRSSTTSLVQFEEMEDSTGNDVSQDMVIIHDVSPDYARKGLDKMQQSIKKHMDDMCVKLQKHLDKKGNLNYQKIWTCYERIFFTIVYSSLEQIYKLAYMDVLIGLRESVPKLTPAALDMVDNNCVYKMFCDKKDDTLTTVNNATSEDLKIGVNDNVFEETTDNSQRKPTAQENESSLNIKDLMRKTRLISEPLQSGGDKTDASDHMSKQLTRKINRETAIYQGQVESAFSGIDKYLLKTSEYRGLPYKLQEKSSTCQQKGEVLDDMDNCLQMKTIEILQDPFECSHEINDDETKLSSGKQLSSFFNAEKFALHPDSIISLPTMGFVPPTDQDEKGSESSDINLLLAESLIANSASGQLANEITSHSPCTSQGRSKYANALEKINMDYARQLQKNVHVYYPVSVNYNNSDRNTWPLVRSLEYGEDALITTVPTREDLDKLEESTSLNEAPNVFTKKASLKKMVSKSINIRPEFKENLQGVIIIFQDMCKETTPIDKLKKGFVALRDLGNQVFKIGRQNVDKGMGASADELTDFLVVLLCNIEMKLLIKLYISVQMMRDLIPDFLETGPYGFSVMQLTLGLHFLQERIVMQKGLIQNDMARAYHDDIRVV